MPQDLRPKFLNLFKIYFPCTAIVSIAHRISGVALYLAVPFYLIGLTHVKTLGKACPWVTGFLAQPPGRFLIWALASAFVLHWIAGIRHLLMDASGCHSLAFGRGSAWAVMALTLALVLLTGAQLW